MREIRAACEKWGGHVVEKCVMKIMRTVGGLLEVDVGIAKGATGDHVATHPDGKDWSGRRELLEKHGLSDIGVKIADIK